MTDRREQIHVSLLATPDAMVSPVSGLYEVLNAFELLRSFDDAAPEAAPFHVDIVAPEAVPTSTASGLPLNAHCAIGEVDRTDIVIVPLMRVAEGEWVTGRYPAVVDWLCDMHSRGAMLCSTCTGGLLLAETGLLDGRETTTHWAYAPTFRRNFPKVRLRLEETLVVAGDCGEFVMSGASASWHDLVLYLIARQIGPTAAQAMAKFMLLQWHAEGQAPYVAFSAPTDHGDAVVLDAQLWLEHSFSGASPVEELVKRAGIPQRSFKRRFTQATGYPPIAYVQCLRIEDAKRRLERTDVPVDEISWRVGYEDPAFFRRLFKRVAGISPGAYRRKLRVPKFAKPRTQPAASAPD